MYHNTSDSSSNSSNPKPQDTLSNKHRPSPKKIKKKHKKSLSATYKTKKCEYYNRGNCNKGHNCTFNHNFIPDCSKVTYYLTGRNCANIFLRVSVKLVNSVPFHTTLRGIPVSIITFLNIVIINLSNVGTHMGLPLQLKFKKFS